jgi:hypothetical protein
MGIILGRIFFIQNEILLLDFFGFKIQKNPLFPPSDMYGNNEDLLGKYLKKYPHQREKIRRTVLIEHNTFRITV